MGVHSNETRKEQQTGQGSQQRQDEKNRQDFNRDNPSEAKGQNTPNQGCESDMGEGQHCGTEGQKKDQPQQKGQSQPQRQNK